MREMFIISSIVIGGPQDVGLGRDSVVALHRWRGLPIDNESSTRILQMIN